MYATDGRPLIIAIDLTNNSSSLNQSPCFTVISCKAYEKHTKASSFFMGSCLIYSNTVVAGLIVGQMYEMLRHPVPGVLNISMKKRTIATMTRGRKCYILLQFLHTTFLMITGLVVS